MAYECAHTTTVIMCRTIADLASQSSKRGVHSKLHNMHENSTNTKPAQGRDDSCRPIIFIGHSYGGIVIQEAIIQANGSHDFQHLATATVGVVFLGTPHRGTQAVEWGMFIARTGNELGFGSSDSILRELTEDSEGLTDLRYQFTIWLNRNSARTYCYFEQHRTNYGRRWGLLWREMVSLTIFGRLDLCLRYTDKVVGETSACLDGYRKLALPADHLKLNKYTGPEDPCYKSVYPVIVEMARDGSKNVRYRFDRKDKLYNRPYM